MIESKVIEYLDFGDLIQSIDAYSKKKFNFILSFFRVLSNNKFFPLIIDIILIFIYFFQIWTMALIFVPSEGDFILIILDYLKKITVLYEIISNESTYLILFMTSFIIIMVDIILMIIVLFIHKKIKTRLVIFIINFLNIIIFYYLIGPIINIGLESILCNNNTHKYLQIACFSNAKHLLITILSLLMILLYIFISFLYTFYSNEMEAIKTISLKENTFIINCNYDVFCLISKIIIFALGFFVKRGGNNYIYKSLYESYIIMNCLLMSIYSYRSVYFYNFIINYIHHFGWYISTSYSLCILLKTLLNLNGVSNFIVFGWIIIIISVYKAQKIREYVLITQNNIFEFKDVISIEMYKNILLNNLRNKNNNGARILILGIIKKFEEFTKNNPEFNYYFNKLLKDTNIIKKINKEDDLPILAIIYILYSFYSLKLVKKEEIIFRMCYFLINKFNNPAYSMFLCSKLKVEALKGLYYKYCLSEDIKEYLIFKLKKKKNTESLKHIQIGSVILYYLYTDLFKIKIYDATTNQIDYFDLLKNNITTNKTTKNLLKSSESILKCRKEIMNIWEKIIELNPFSDEFQRDYILYLDSIIQDEFLLKEESTKYLLLKNSKSIEKNNLYYKMFLTDTSSVLLVDGYFSNGKILYSSKNFQNLFLYTGKEILTLSIDDLLPNPIQMFHKELIENAIKFTNINYNFKGPKDSLLKNKNGGLFNIKLYVKLVPNLYYGLIFYVYLQKNNDQKFIIVLDNDLKINGFTEIVQNGSLFTLGNAYNLSYNIIGSNIGLIIPEILTSIEYKNGEFNIIKTNYELKGFLYPIEKTKEIKNKINIILDKIKNNKISINDYQGQIEDDPQNISIEYNELIKELNKQKIKPFNIFYRIILYSFLDGKYKYYRIYINNSVLNENTLKLIKDNQESQNGKIKFNYDFKSSHSKISKDSNKKLIIVAGDKKQIAYTNKTNKSNRLEYSMISRSFKMTNQKNIKKQEYIKSLEDSNNENNNILNNEKNISNKINAIYNSKSNIAMSGFNKIKNDIINDKEIIPIKLMKIICYLFGFVALVFMAFELMNQINSFNNLSDFFIDNLFFNKTKIAVGSLYAISVNIRWLSHSIFENSTSCLYGNWTEFYLILLKESLKYIEGQKNASNYLGEDFSNILTQKFPFELYVHRIPEKEKYDFSLDNIMTFLVNSIIKMIDMYDYFSSLKCQNISKIIGLNETKLQNLIEQSYNLYISNISGFTGEEKLDRVNKNFASNQIPLFVYCLFLLFFLIVYIYYTLNLYHVEIYFLEKLINFNSTNFDNYLKKLDEIKKKFRNDNSEEEEKADDLDFIDLDSKKKEEEDIDRTEIKEEKKYDDKGKKKKNKRGGNHQNKIRQLKKKKLKLMKLFFSQTNLFFIIKIIFIMIITLSYYFVVNLLKSKFKNDFLLFDSINDSILGVYKDSYDLFILFKREMDIYEREFISCTESENQYYLKLPYSNNITTPKLGNLLMQITGASSFKKGTIDQFNSLYSGNACEIIADTPLDFEYCGKYWSGVLLKGMEQAITHMGVVISTVINELQTLNLFKVNTVLFNLMDQSYFITYEQFIEYYLLRAYNKTTYIFRELREEKLNSIITVMLYILFSYVFITIILFVILIYVLFNYKYILNSFLNFIGIFPIQYKSEDENLYYEIIRFGNKYF